MHVLLTGSSGTIGTRLTEKLLEQGHTVTGVDWEECKWRPEFNDHTIITDLRDHSSIDKLPSDVDIIIHLAANARVYELVENPDRAYDNVTTTFHALEYARKVGCKKFIFASSRESYGNIDVESYREDCVRIENCESPYTASKLAGEAFVESYSRCYGIDHIIFRFSNVYGAYDDSVRVVPLFIRQARANEDMCVFGAAKCLDFTYIDDCCDGIILGATKFDDVKNDRYNLAYGKGTTLIHLAERVRDLIGSTGDITMGEVRTGEVIRYVANIDHAKDVLGYSPKYEFDEGIERAVEWYLKYT